MLGCPGLYKQLGGIEGCPSQIDVRLGCGVVGQFPQGGVPAVRVGEAPGTACAHVPGFTLPANPAQRPPG